MGRKRERVENNLAGFVEKGTAFIEATKEFSIGLYADIMLRLCCEYAVRNKYSVKQVLDKMQDVLKEYEME